MFEPPRRDIDADATRTKTRELEREPRRAAAELENVLPRDVPEDAEFAFRNRPAAPDNLVNAELLVVLGLVRVADPIPSGAVLCDVISRHCLRARQISSSGQRSAHWRENV